MKFDLDNVYFVQSIDRFNVTLTKRSKTIKGKDAEKTEGYYDSIASAIKGYFKIKQLTAKTTTIKGLLDYQENLIKSLNKALLPLKIDVATPQKLKDKFKNNGDYK